MSAMRKVSDPYRVLGVSRGADATQIKAAHRRLAKRHHPDAPGGDEARFVAIQEAYLLLSDPLRRREWDRKHAPGPVDAREHGTRAGARAASARWTREDAGAYRRTRTTRGPTGAGRQGEAGPAPAPGATGSGRDPGTRRGTWSAEGVPWWEDFTPKSRGATSRRQAGDRARAASAGTRPGGDMDVFSRSSGAAWSSAARRHFRRDEATLPSRGAFRYRGSQVVTGAEARMLAEQEAAQQEAAAAALFRKARPAASGRPPRQAFDHEQPGAPKERDGDARRATPAPTPPPMTATPPPEATTPTTPAPAAAPTPARPESRAAQPSAARPPVTRPVASPKHAEPREHTAASSAPVVVGALAATIIAAVPVVLGVSAGAIDPAAPPAVGTLLVGALIGGVSGWLLARTRGHASR
jgi:curved DNA-binding protein CbpA